jgi:hypothetical protein
MKRVIIESPYRGASQAERLRNVSYLKRCIRDCVLRGESPYASHMMLLGALDEDVPEERQRGIEAGYEWWNVAELIVFYTDYGWSAGMQKAMAFAITRGKRCEQRTLPVPADIPLNDLAP